MSFPLKVSVYVLIFIVAVGFELFANGAEEQNNETSNPSARPAPIPLSQNQEVAKQKHIDVGFGPSFITRHVDESKIHYKPSIGYQIQAAWNIFSLLETQVYVSHSNHALSFQKNAILPNSVTESDSAESYSLGACLGLSFFQGYSIGLKAGIGWGRMEFPKMNVTDSSGTYFVDERAFSFVEIPLGLGVSYPLLKNWISIYGESTYFLHSSQKGGAIENSQTVNGFGEIVHVSGLPKFQSSWSQTIGLLFTF